MHGLPDVLRDHFVLGGLIQICKDIQLAKMLLELLHGLVIVAVCFKQMLLPFQGLGID